MKMEAAGSPKLPSPDKPGGQARVRDLTPSRSGILLIVGIGASAGGLEAFKSFFSAVPADTGMAFVLVQHLSPDHKSMLAELVGRVTAMDVIEAADGVMVKPNCVFVIPPDATMTIKGGRLKIVRPAPPRDRRRPIDTFFKSLGEDQGENAVCIILSGTGNDGAQGLTTVKEHGGLTLAQAEFDHHALPGMPQSAENTGLVDEVLAVEAMPERINLYRSQLANVASSKNSEGVRQDAVPHLSSILRALHARTGHDFREYKEKTLVRRLQRRMQVLGVETPEVYMGRVSKHPEELDSLLRELLIGVTQFFRDPGAFEALNDTVLKGLVAGKGAADEVRVWVPGCATGEEAYTIAILLREAMDARRRRPKVQIFGTDLDERAIAAARIGHYRAPIAGLSAERTERWFSGESEDRCVVTEIREMCIFSVHSVIKHPPFSKLDLISCRNLLIYLDAPIQDRVMRTFHYGLKPDGHLFLGASESVTRATKLFGVTDKKHRIFERRDVPTASLPFSSDRVREGAVPELEYASGDDRIDKAARRVMEKHYPPHLVLDRTDHIVRFSGGAMGQYLEPAPGAPSFALFDILRKTLRPAAREVLRQVRAGVEPVRRDGVPIRIDGKPRLVSLIAERLADHGPDAEFVVLALHDAGPGSLRVKSSETGGKPVEALQSVQHELRTTQTQLQSTINELETANEELKSSNEEYQSVNEELQSTNEELETAKEEMQSTNEELQTLNGEMGGKNERLTQLNTDLSNLVESAKIKTLFLDEDLKVRRFTPGVNEVFHLRDADVGRPITEIVSLLDYVDLHRDVKMVLSKLSTVEREVTLQDTKAVFILRIRPYRTVDNVIDGVVLTFVDISERKKGEEAHARLAAIVEYSDDAIISKDLNGLITAWNAGAERLFGYTDREAIGQPVAMLMPPERVDEARGILDRIRRGERVKHYETVRRRKDGALFDVSLTLSPIMDSQGNVVGASKIARDITERKRAEEAVGRLAAIVESSLDALFGEDLDGIITSWNRGAEQIFGYRAEEIVGTSIMRLMPADRQAAEHDLQRQIVAGELGGTFEAIRLTKEGREFPASITIAPTKDATGKVIGTSRVLRDITERTRAEETLRASQEQLRVAVAAAKLGQWSLDLRTSEMTCSEGCKANFGRRPDDRFTYDDLWATIQPDDVDRVRAAVKWAVEDRTDYDTEYQTVWPDGSLHWVIVRGLAQYAPDGTPLVMTGVTLDITDRKAAEEALRASHERMRLAAEATGVGVWEWNVLTNEILWDPQMFHLYGVEPTANGIVPYETWSGAIAPEDLSRQERLMNEVIRMGGTGHREFHIRKADDQQVRCLRAVETVRTNAAGQVEWLVGTNFDITEQRDTEAALRTGEARFAAAVDAVQGILWTNNAAGEMEGEQPGWGRLTGQTAEQYQGFGWVEAVHPDDAQPTIDAWKIAVAERRTFAFEHRVRCHDGAWRQFSIRAIPMLDADGSITQWVGVHTDISKEREAEELQELLLRELDHRVKNLFAVVGGMVTLSARSATSPQELAATIQGRLGALASAHQLIRPKHMAVNGDRQETTLDELVRKVLSPHDDSPETGDDARVEIDGPEIAVGTDAATNVALLVHELATNAAKYGALSVPGGQVRISWAAANGRLAMSWEERGGPIIKAPPERQGFGSLLARRSVNGQLGGDLIFHWNSEGLVVQLSADMERLAR